MKLARSLSFLALLSTFMALPITTGCGLLHAAIPVIEDILSIVADAQALLEAISAAAAIFFAAHPELHDQQVVFQKKYGQCEVALDTITRLGRGGEAADKGQLEQAFNEFRAAYTDLEQLVGSLGIKSGDKLAAGRDVVTLPAPIAMTYHAR